MVTSERIDARNVALQRSAGKALQIVEAFTGLEHDPKRTYKKFNPNKEHNTREWTAGENALRGLRRVDACYDLRKTKLTVGVLLVTDVAQSRLEADFGLDGYQKSRFTLPDPSRGTVEVSSGADFESLTYQDEWHIRVIEEMIGKVAEESARSPGRF